MARQIGYFIDNDYLLKWYPGYLDANIDPNLLYQFILRSQSENLQEILGYNLYIKYNNDIASTGAPDQTGQYVYLMVNFIQPATALWTIYHAIPTMNFRLTNKAMSQKSSDNSQPSGITEVEYVRKDIRNAAEFATQRIREFIINDLNSFPEYMQLTGLDRITAKPNNYFGGIALGTTNKNRDGYHDPYFGGPCCD